MLYAHSPHKVLFLNEASSLIGMGHIVRSQVLARIMNSRGYIISGITVGDRKAVLFAEERAKRDKFEWPVRIALDIPHAIESISHDLPSVILMDGSFVSPAIVERCADIGVPTVALDYFISEPPMPAAVINLIDHHPASISGNPPFRQSITYCEGPQYAIIRDEFIAARARRISRGERIEVKKILIAFGGADPSGNSRRAFEMILSWPGEFVVDLIIGPLFTSKIEQSESGLQKKCVIREHKSPDCMGDLFEDADLVFCGGGGTLLEAMCVGVPSIVIAQNDAELRHARSLAKRDACWISGDADWEFMNRIENRQKLSASARECVDGQGAERICDIIEQQLN